MNNPIPSFESASSAPEKFKLPRAVGAFFLMPLISLVVIVLTAILVSILGRFLISSAISRNILTIVITPIAPIVCSYFVWRNWHKEKYVRIISITAFLLFSPLFLLPYYVVTTSFTPGSKSLNTLINLETEIKRAALFTNIESLLSKKEYNQAFSELRSAPDAFTNEIILWIVKNQATLPAPFLYELGNRVFPTNNHEGLMWYFVGGIRARYDATRCKDQTAGQGILVLNTAYENLVEFARKNQTQASRAGSDAIRWDKDHAYDASPLWICAHGIDFYTKKFEGGTLSEQDMFVSEAQWPSLREEVYKGLAEFLNK